MDDEARLGLSDERRHVPHRPRPFGRRAGDQVELTERQREVLQLVADGLENKEIAGLLGISEQGVKQQVSVLLKKFDAPSRATLARTALTMKLLGTTARSTDIPLEYLFDRAPLLIGMTGGPEHRVVLVNRAVRDLFGERQYIGLPLREAFQDAEAGVFAHLARIYDTGQAYRTNEQRVRFTLPDGMSREVYLSFIAEPRRSASGAVDGVVFYGWDITENVRMRERLHRLTVEQRTLVEQLPVGVVYTDERGHPVLVNPVARRILGGTFDPDRPMYAQLDDWKVRLTADGTPLGPAAAPSARALAGWPFDGECDMTSPDGRELRLHVSARPLHDERGKVTGAVLLLTERGRADRSATAG